MANKISPELMSPAERVGEACRLLATGILRSRTATNDPDSTSGLDFSDDQSGPEREPETGQGDDH